MKIELYIIVTLLMLFAGCSESDPTATIAGKQEAGTVIVHFKAGSETVTRTNLNSSDNFQHITYVHLYVFDHNGVCIQSNNVEWEQVMGETVTQAYTLQGLAEGETYTLLAVGLDENPMEGNRTTYNIPDAIQEGSTTLTSLSALLDEGRGKTQANIAQSELFSGWEEVAVGGTATVTINLYRRVAGILGYFKDIPDDVSAIRVVLYKNQYKDVPLQKADKSNISDVTDHGSTELGNSTVIMNIPVSDAEKNRTELTDGFGNIVTKQVGTVMQGAYMLPVEAPDPHMYTIWVQTLGVGGNLLKTYYVNMLVPVSGGGSTTEELQTDFSLLANHFYTIGKRNVNENIDEPISLAEDLVVAVDPGWEGIDVPIPLE